MINQIKHDSETRMKKTLETLRHDFGKIRTGRANVSFLDHVIVEYYGNPTPINQVASITITDSRTLSVTPFDKTLIAHIEKAILNSDLGLNPVNTGHVLRVPMPPLNEERRKEMIRIVRGEAEQGKVAIRNIRRDANAQLKDLVKDKTISEDEERRAEESMQKLTDHYVKEIDQVLAEKEKDLLEV